MENIKFIVDSSCDITPEMQKEYDIAVVPLSVSFGDRHFTDRVDISSELFFELLKKTEGELPKTAQPSPYRFEEEFRKWDGKYTDIICVCVSSQMSGTYNSAQMAGAALKDDPNCSVRVHVVDSLNASIGILITVFAGTQYAAAGHPVEEVLAHMEEVKRCAAIYFVLDTLEYVRRGGRIGLIKSVVGSLLNIKPVMTFVKGIPIDTDKARGMAQAIERLLSVFSQKAADLKEVIIIHAHCPDRAMEFAAGFARRFSRIRIRICEVGATMGTFTGEGGIGFAMMEKEPRWS